jgi:hypothetical protein
MLNNDTITRRKLLDAEAADATVEAGGPSPLLEQAQAWADLAREVHANIVKGDEAERVLHQRRNTSGQ